MADIFNENNEQQINLGLNDLVGEGKKYSDPDQLANAYANAEAFMERLKAENAELRAFKDTQDANNKNQNPADKGLESVQTNDSKNEPPKKPTTGDEDFRSQIKAEVERLNTEQRALSNLDTAAKRLSEHVGSEAKASEAIRSKAQELDVSVEWLKEMAMRSPQAFYTTMGIPQGHSVARTPSPSSDIRLDDTGNVKNFEYYDKLRKDNPKLYFDRTTQSEMMNQARKLGADFYKR